VTPDQETTNDMRPNRTEAELMDSQTAR